MTQLSGKKFKPAIEAPHRWRDWAAKSDGITGDELLAFINNEETTQPGGKKGRLPFRLLRTLTNSNQYLAEAILKGGSPLHGGQKADVEGPGLVQGLARFLSSSELLTPWTAWINTELSR